MDKKIGLGLIIFCAVILVFLGDKHPYQKATNGEINEVSAMQVAEALIEEPFKMMILDLTKSDQNASPLHLKKSVPVNGEDFLASKPRLVPNLRYVVLANTDEMAQKVFYHLRSYGYEAQVMKGGVQGWRSEVLNPRKPEQGSDAELLAYYKAQSVSNYLQGKGQDSTIEKDPIPRKRVFKLPPPGGKSDEGC